MTIVNTNLMEELQLFYDQEYAGQHYPPFKELTEIEKQGLQKTIAFQRWQKLRRLQRLRGQVFAANYVISHRFKS